MLWGGSIALFCVQTGILWAPECVCASSPVPTTSHTHTKQTYLASAVTLQYTNLGKIRLRIQQEKNTQTFAPLRIKCILLQSSFTASPYAFVHTNTCVKSHSSTLSFSLSLLFHTPAHSQKMCKKTLPHKQNTHRIFLWEMALKGELGNSLSHSKRHPTHCS